MRAASISGVLRAHPSLGMRETACGVCSRSFQRHHGPTVGVDATGDGHSDLHTQMNPSATTLEKCRGNGEPDGENRNHHRRSTACNGIHSNRTACVAGITTNDTAGPSLRHRTPRVCASTTVPCGNRHPAGTDVKPATGTSRVGAMALLAAGHQRPADDTFV